MDATFYKDYYDIYVKVYYKSYVITPVANIIFLIVLYCELKQRYGYSKD